MGKLCPILSHADSVLRIEIPKDAFSPAPLTRLGDPRSERHLKPRSFLKAFPAAGEKDSLAFEAALWFKGSESSQLED
jgi:hypothetical protein